MDSHYR